MAMPRSATIPEPPRSKWHGVRTSLEEYEKLPEEKPYLEYWDGVVLQKDVPKLDHYRVAKRAGYRLVQYEDRFGGDSGPEGHVWFEGRGYLVPDLSYYAPGKVQGDFDRMLPLTLAIEIRSSGQRLSPLQKKCRNMRAEGVDVCWLIDPRRRVAYVFEGDRDGELVPATGMLSSPHLPEFELPLALLWAELDR